MLCAWFGLGRSVGLERGPEIRPVQLSNEGRVVEVPEVGGLHHHYERMLHDARCGDVSSKRIAWVFGSECVQVRLTGSVGVSPTGGTVRTPVAWVASVEETKRRKPTDQAILGMVSESPGRNAREPTSGLVRK